MRRCTSCFSRLRARKRGCGAIPRADRRRWSVHWRRRERRRASGWPSGVRASHARPTSLELAVYAFDRFGKREPLGLHARERPCELTGPRERRLELFLGGIDVGIGGRQESIELGFLGGLERHRLLELGLTHEQRFFEVRALLPRLCLRTLARLPIGRCGRIAGVRCGGDPVCISLPEDSIAVVVEITLEGNDARVV